LVKFEPPPRGECTLAQRPNPTIPAFTGLSLIAALTKTFQLSKTEQFLANSQI
jgi:hypothetical protein